MLAHIMNQEQRDIQSGRLLDKEYRCWLNIYFYRQENSTLKLRGRRLILEYRNGSPCGDRGTGRKEDNDQLRRKSSIISFHCDKDPLAAPSSGIVTYVGNSDDECSYYFEVLSKVACMTAEPTKQSIGPGAVFALICIIAILVYFLGGVFYQRNVAHARGWRQLPNYVIWAGIGNFIKVSWHFFSHRISLQKPPRVTSLRGGLVSIMDVRSQPFKFQKSYATR